jgi:hypothetical protein
VSDVGAIVLFKNGEQRDLHRANQKGQSAAPARTSLSIGLT